VDRAINLAEPIGGMWLNALRMTIVPLVVSLLVVGNCRDGGGGAGEQACGPVHDPVRQHLVGSDYNRGHPHPLLLNLFPLPEQAAASLRAALTTTERSATHPASPIS
jgi:hypothetical protein